MSRGPLRRIRRKLKRELRWVSTKLESIARRQRKKRHKKRERRRRSGDDPSLSFSERPSWAWALRVLEEEQPVGVAYSANPLALLATVEEFVLRHGEPEPGFGIEICNNRNGRCLAVNGQLLGRRDTPTSNDDRLARLRTIDPRLDRYMARFADSSSVTVMTDEVGEVVNSRQLLKRIFTSGTEAQTAS